MSKTIRKRKRLSSRNHAAPIFAALGDDTRLTLLMKLGSGSPISITHLSGNFALTRQAVTKHLRILEQARLVSRSRRGRETLYELCSSTLDEARQSLDRISKQWDVALASLKSFVERD